MNQKEIKELIELLVEKDITEFELERGDMKVHVKRGSTAAPVVPLAPAVAGVQPFPVATATPTPPSSATPQAGPGRTSAPPAPSPESEAASDADLFIVKSPIVGTYYEAASPGTPPFVKVGDAVKEGQVLGIIEAMKLMNEIESDVAGEVVKCLVSNGQAIEFGQPLYSIRPA